MLVRLEIHFLSKETHGFHPADFTKLTADRYTVYISFTDFYAHGAQNVENRENTFNWCTVFTAPIVSKPSVSRMTLGEDNLYRISPEVS